MLSYIKQIQVILIWNHRTTTGKFLAWFWDSKLVDFNRKKAKIVIYYQSWVNSWSILGNAGFPS